ncbi:hypothetical protein V2J09_009573 [Rumex salicifolius]
MGTHKFKLSNITPNALFYKLKQMRNNNNNKSIKNSKATTNLDQASNEAAAAISIPTSTSSPLQATISQSRKSYHIKSSVDPPMKLKPSRKRRPTTKSSAACSCATAAVHSVRSKSTTTTTSSSSIDNLSLPPEARCFDRMIALSSTSCNCSSNSLVADFDDDDDDEDDAVLIGVDRLSLAPNTEDTAISKIDLPPIKTEHKKFSDLVEEIGPRKQRRSPVRRTSASSGSPRVESHGGRRKSEPHRRHVREKSSESMAVVKSSTDPERDFRESMVEMIVENEIRAAKDLEELLACYLSLNSVEYHRLIIQAFKQICR